MTELTEFIEELREFISDRQEEIDERKEEIANEIIKDKYGVKINTLNKEIKALSGEMEGYIQVCTFINDKGL